MSNSISRFVLPLSLGALFVTGCGSETPKKTVSAARPVAAKQEPPKPLLDKDVPQTADAAVRAVFDGLKADKPVAFWNAIARSKRETVERSVRELAALIDPEVWDRTVANLKKLVHLAETKKDWLLANDLLKKNKQINLAELKAAWEPGVAFLKTVVDSELVDREKMQHFDGRAFFEGTGAKLYAQARAVSHALKDDPLKRLDGIKTTVKETSPTTAVLTVEFPPPNPQKRDFKLLIEGGQWTADRFKIIELASTLGLTPVRFVFMPYETVEWKDKYLKDMERVGKTVDALQAAKTNDEFREIVALRVVLLGAQIMSDFRPSRKQLEPWEVMSRARSKDQALVLVAGEHESDEHDVLELTKLLRDHVSGKPASYFAGPNRAAGVTVYLLGPVSDIKALAGDIKLGKITQIDAKRNLLKITVAPAPQPDKAAADASAPSKGT